MIDREKVIAKLDEEIRLGEHWGEIDRSIDMVLLRDIDSLLKEQKPKAIEYHDNPFTGLPVAHCPNCMRYAQQFHSFVEEETHYCPWCGQEVKWNDSF